MASAHSFLTIYLGLELLSLSLFEADQLEDFKGLAERSPWFAPGAEMRLVISINGFVVLVLGLVPGTLMGMCLNAVSG